MLTITPLNLSIEFGNTLYIGGSLVWIIIKLKSPNDWNRRGLINMAELHHTWCRCNLIFKIYTHRNQIVPSRKNFLFRWKTKKKRTEVIRLDTSETLFRDTFSWTACVRRGVELGWEACISFEWGDIISNNPAEKKDHSGSQFSLVFTFRMRTVLNNGSIFLYFWNMKWGGTSLW